MWYYDLIDYDETFYYEEEIVSGKPVSAKVELERRFDANVVLWADDGRPKDWRATNLGAYVDLHKIDRPQVERVDQNHVKVLPRPDARREAVRPLLGHLQAPQGPARSSTATSAANRSSALSRPVRGG